MPRGDKPTTVALALKDGWVYEDTLPASITKEEYDWWFRESLVLDGVRMGPPLATKPQSATEETPVNVHALTVFVCQDCIDLKGVMCNNAECVFCRRTMVEVQRYLDVMLLCPIVDGRRQILVGDAVTNEDARAPAGAAPVVDALCMALETAINSVECGSIDSNTGEELPWYKQAHEALRLAGRPWKGIRHE